jgi:cytochrome c nitrite reductase small subunit
MGLLLSRRTVLGSVVVAILSLGIGAFMLLGPPQLLAKSESAMFCAECHADEYAAWSHAGAHRRLKCVDCHLPNANPAEHYFWKSIDGVKDVVSFNLGFMSDRITITGHGEEVIQQNCIRCHEARVSVIDRTRRCWGCHRRLRHYLTGNMQTRSTSGEGEQAWK